MNWQSKVKPATCTQRLLLISILGPAGLFAPGSAPQSIIALSSGSEAIVVCSVSPAAYANDTVTVTIVVERSLKGGLGVGASYSVLWRDTSRYRPVVNSRSLRGLLFLKRDSGGLWTVIPALSGYISDVRRLFVVFPPTSAPPASANALPMLDRIFAEILAAEEAGGLDPSGGIVDLVGSYRAALSPAARAMFGGLGNSPSAKLRLIGLLAMLSDGDIATLARVEREQHSLAAGASGRLVMSELAQNFRNQDPAAIQILGRMATSPAGHSAFREAAARALALIHTREALPFLAALLDSPSVALKGYAVGGLAGFANNISARTHHPEPGDWPYRTEETMAHSAMGERAISTRETYYIGFWKTWWLQFRDQLTTVKP